jgi:hypothetical protein
MASNGFEEGGDHRVMNKLKISAITLFLGSWVLLGSALKGREWQVITYGFSKPDYIKSMGITALRGKFDPDDRALNAYGRAILVLKNANVYRFPYEQMVTEAEEYARKSGGTKLYELDIDDAMDWYNQARIAKKTQVFDAIAKAIKHNNPDLKFGLTIYTSELPGESPLSPNIMSWAQREMVNVVHLFLDHRTDYKNLPDYVAEAKRYFPHAGVVVGLYNTDRRQVEKRSGTIQDEVQLFSQGLDEACKLAEQGKILGIEFHPGRFGLEENLYAKDPDGKAVATALRDATVSILKAHPN